MKIFIVYIDYEGLPEEVKAFSTRDKAEAYFNSLDHIWDADEKDEAGNPALHSDYRVSGIHKATLDEEKED